MAEVHGSGTARPVEEVLADLDRLVDELSGALGPSTGATDATARETVTTSRLVATSARLRVAGTRLDAVRWSILPRIESAGLWAQTGARTFAVWLARTEDTQNQTARRDVRTARALRDHLPATLLAALSGRVSSDKVRALVDVATTSTSRTEALAAPAIDLATIEPVTGEPVMGGPVMGGPAMEGPVMGGPANGDPVISDLAGATGPDEWTDPTSGDPVVDCATGQALAPAGPTWEEQLLDWSTQNGPDRFRGLVRYFARHADPEADERGFTKAGQREYLDVAPTLGGYHLSGFLTEEHGQTLTTAIASVMGAPAADDDRTPGQRRAQALADLSRVVLDNGHTGSGAAVRPHLSVTVSWSELQALAANSTAKNAARTSVRRTAEENPPGTGAAAPSRTRRSSAGSGTPNGVPDIKRPAVFTETSSPVPASLLRRIACDSEVTRIVFGPDSQILDVGRAKRTVTGQLRRAVIARDKHCVYDQCDQPPTRCEVHHALRHWAHGGETSTTNAALLCYHHHDMVDKQDITMHYDNGWHFTYPNGHVTRPTRTAGA